MVTAGTSKDIALEEIRNRLSECLGRIGVEKVIVFGSYARGTQTRRSDIDLLVVMKTDKRYFDRYDDLRPVFDALQGHAVEILIHTPEELERNKERPFMRTILAEGVTIYGG